MNIKKEFILRNIVDENILVPVGETAMSFNGLITLNKVGAFIWSKLGEVETEEEIVNLVLEKYNVSRDIAELDVKEFLDQLRDSEII